MTNDKCLQTVKFSKKDKKNIFGAFLLFFLVCWLDSNVKNKFDYRFVISTTKKFHTKSIQNVGNFSKKCFYKALWRWRETLGGSIMFVQIELARISSIRISGVYMRVGRCWQGRTFGKFNFITMHTKLWLWIQKQNMSGYRPVWFDISQFGTFRLSEAWWMIFLTMKLIFQHTPYSIFIKYI